MPKKNFNPYFSMYTKINSKWITDLNRKSKTIKLLKEIGIKLLSLGFGKYFFAITPEVLSI